MTGNADKTRTWYGDYELELGRTASWQVGPMSFWLTPSDHEWRFACLQADDSLDPARVFDPSGNTPEPAEAEDSARRLGFGQTQGRLRLTPMTADRPVVVKPATPFLLPPKEELTLFISTILWVKVEVGDPLKEFLQVPLYRPSDTWFGASTRDGEMCYALQTSARLRLENLPLRPHRAITALRVRNRDHENLPVEKVMLPMPHMSLFADENGQLWTQEITLEHTHGRHDAPLDLSEGPPPQAGSHRHISGPRIKPVKGLLTRAFGGLMGGGY